jgi:hypothetical protein
VKPDGSLSECGPEKAGIGGSIPSLATTLSITYQSVSPRFHSNSFQLARRDSPRIDAWTDRIRLCRCEGRAAPGEFPLVTTAEKKSLCDHFDFDVKAALIPMVSSTGHGSATLNRLHYHEGKFALGSILCAVIPFREEIFSAHFIFEYLSAFKEDLLVSRMTGTANVTLTLNRIGEIPIRCTVRLFSIQDVVNFSEHGAQSSH